VSVLLVILIAISRRRQPESYSVVGNPDEDVRENIIHYNEEGVGKSSSQFHLDRVIGSLACGAIWCLMEFSN